MRTQTIMIYHLTIFRSDLACTCTKRQQITRMWRKGNPSILWKLFRLVQSLRKMVWWFLNKLKLKIHNPAISLMDIYLNEAKTLI